GRWPRHRLHPGLRDRRQPVPRRRDGRSLRTGRRLHPRRAARRHPSGAQRGPGAGPLRRAPGRLRATVEAGRDAASRPGPALALEAADGHRFELLARIPERPRRSLLWLPALGVAARHYLPLADALAARGVAVFLHEWRGHGSSSLRAGRHCDWAYRELLTLDLPASEAAIAAATPGLQRIAGGHSLGGQLAACRLGLDPAAFDALWLAGSGAPYWRAFPLPQRLVLPLAYRALPWLAARA